ncbi:type I-C CRISPR-associated protein Cas8c/Csd1 [Psychrobacter phenylpyruvicus]|uniref:CRISPR-associated protein Cas8c/Csd1, subtype I-C/DVULG n=1 Tax=Psychrobacter phenylpyruvicus TaxID=29432 RepID=A0A379LLC7_9GAMM|nr:type I-C CRISPR-associated protein Cas8c/Csd1 [Psychrobacter phenylpyruvicus]SUD90574.1 CRISPR-associated protein Cas8c/Csd1, subtype I-C/DVULG [Psychrobacter phenylpyruvicus]
MILHALTEYYHRKADSTEGSGIAPQGFENKQIPFIVVIDKQGSFFNLEDTRGKDKTTKKGSSFLVPLGETRSGKNSYQTTNILWDHYGYLLNHAKEIAGNAKMSAEKLATETEKSIEMANLQHQTFIEKVEELHRAIPDDIGILAVKKFLTDPDNIQQVKEHPKWEDCKKIKGCNLTFKLKGETALICQSKSIQEYLKQQLTTPSTDTDSVEALCLITGDKAPIARLHQPISGVNAKPAPFASINLDAFESYYKTQGYGFPVSEKAMFEYTTALNTLLKSNNRFRLGDVSVVCWSEKATKMESDLAFILNGGQDKDNPDAYIESVKKLFSSFHHGVYDNPDANQIMYVLGLSPNSARIVVRFWHQATIATLATNIAQWFIDVDIVRGLNQPYPALLRLLCNLVFEGKIENLPPNMVANVTKSILDNSPLPMTVLQLAIRRNRADQSVTYARACLIKAYLNRKIRTSKTTTIKEISVGYDKDRTDIGYVLGALFAVLEKIQEETSESGKLNSTIRDRYYGSASSTPVTVFGTLLKLTQHHLSKISKRNMGRSINLNKYLSEILEKIDNFPSHLNMEQQGLFAIGYYHRRQDFFNKKETDDSNPESLKA